MFQLPAVYYIVPPLFVVTAFITPRPLLFWSFKPYWASTAAAFWVSTVLLQLSGWWGSQQEFRDEWWAAIGRCVVYGLMLGLLSTFRREVGTLGMASIGAYVVFLQFGNGQISDRAKRWAFSAAVVLAVFIGTQAPQWGMSGAWFLRDCLYEMTDPAELISWRIATNRAAC